MAKYDRQLIIVFLTGDAKDAPIEAQARALNDKERTEPLESEIVTVRRGAAPAGRFAAPSVEELRHAIAGQCRVSRAITTSSRVYLLGSGDWQQRTMAGWHPQEVADLLGEVDMPAVKVISIVADQLGRGSSAIDQQEQPECFGSFAAIFHRRLKENCQIRTVIHARVLRVAVVLPDTVETPMAGTHGPGRKVTALEGDAAAETLSRGHQRSRSKVRFYWWDDEQRAEWAY